ncbi:MAG: hypothetical protein ABIJ26_07235 [Candidatus Margulisiibacteriota bacterium]
MKSRYSCPVCDDPVDLPDTIKAGYRFTCPNWSAQLIIRTFSGKHEVRCAICPTPDMIECDESCERKISEPRRKGFFDIDLS